MSADAWAHLLWPMIVRPDGARNARMHHSLGICEKEIGRSQQQTLQTTNARDRGLPAPAIVCNAVRVVETLPPYGALAFSRNRVGNHTAAAAADRATVVHVLQFPKQLPGRALRLQGLGTQNAAGYNFRTPRRYKSRTAVPTQTPLLSVRPRCLSLGKSSLSSYGCPTSHLTRTRGVPTEI